MSNSLGDINDPSTSGHLLTEKARHLHERISPSKKSQGKAGETSVDDDEYVDEDFDVDESGSLSNPQIVNNLRDPTNSNGKTNKDMMDFNVSASASLLPPLAGGGRRDTLDQQQQAYNSNQSKNDKDFKPLPEHFALNLAESEQSLNFDISDSKTFNAGAFSGTYGKTKDSRQLNDNSSRKNLHEG